jgi:hypothetical protein
MAGRVSLACARVRRPWVPVGPVRIHEIASNALRFARAALSATIEMPDVAPLPFPAHLANLAPHTGIDHLRAELIAVYKTTLPLCFTI